MKVQPVKIRASFLEMGIINPLSMLPYFRIYSCALDMIVDIPCSAWYLRERIAISNNDVMLACHTDNFPVFDNGAWSKEGYYIIEITEEYAKLIDMYGRKRLIFSEKELLRLIKTGQIFNVCNNLQTYPSDLLSFIQDGKVRYRIITQPILRSKLCSKDDIKAVDNLVALRANMLGIKVSGIEWGNYDLFGLRQAESADIPNADMFVIPQGITQVYFHRVNPHPHNVLATNPAFRFIVYDFNMSFDSLIITDALDCTVLADMRCGLFKVRTIHAKVGLRNLHCDRLMLWGVHMQSNKEYQAQIWLNGNDVKELILYHVLIHGDETISLNPGTKIILCDCLFYTDATRKMVMSQATVISEQEMLALWNFQPAVLSNRLYAPGV